MDRWTDNERLKGKNVWWIAVIVGLLAVGGTLRVFPPSPQSWHPKCLFFVATGLHCPGCGTTRAIAALVRGNWVDAFWYNPMLIVGLPLFCVFTSIQRHLGHRSGHRHRSLAIWVATFLLVYFVARNVPSPTTSPFAPPSVTSD